MIRLESLTYGKLLVEREISASHSKLLTVTTFDDKCSENSHRFCIQCFYILIVKMDNF